MNMFNKKFFALICFLYYANMYVLYDSMGWATKIITAALMGVVMCVHAFIVEDIAKNGGFMKGRIWFNLLEE